MTRSLHTLPFALLLVGCDPRDHLDPTVALCQVPELEPWKGENGIVRLPTPSVDDKIPLHLPDAFRCCQPLTLSVPQGSESVPDPVFQLAISGPEAEGCGFWYRYSPHGGWKHCVAEPGEAWDFFDGFRRPALTEDDYRPGPDAKTPRDDCP